jgi:hypothetical protein
MKTEKIKKNGVCILRERFLATVPKSVGKQFVILDCDRDNSGAKIKCSCIERVESALGESTFCLGPDLS